MLLFPSCAHEAIEPKMLLMNGFSICSLLFGLLQLTLSESQPPDGAARADSHSIDFTPAPAAWHLGMPVAGGEIGAMAWGDGHPLILTLDRYDVWELRSWKPDLLRYSYQRWRRLIEEGRASEIREEFETAHWVEREARLLLALSIQTAPLAERSRSGRSPKDADSRAGGAARAEVAAFLSDGESGWTAPSARYHLRFSSQGRPAIEPEGEGRTHESGN